MQAIRRHRPGVALCAALLPGFVLGLPSRAPQAPDETPEAQVRKHFQAGEQAEREGDLIRADSEYRQALGESLIELGLIHHTLGNLDQAELAYRQATQATANSDVALEGLAVVYLRKGDFDKGVETVKVLLDQDPFNGGARYLLGKFYFSKGRYQEAQDQLEEARRVSPDDYGAAYSLAMTKLKLKDLAGGRKVFDEMLAGIGDSPKLHIAFAAAYRQTEHYDEALKELHEVGAKNPAYPRVHYYLAVTVLPSLGRRGFPQAIEELKTELRNHPRDYESNYLLGMLHVEEHELKDAGPYLETAVRLKPDTPDAALYLGQTYELLGRHADAIRLLRKSIELTHDPTRNNYQISNAHYLLGQALLHTGAQEEAKEHLAAADRFKNMQAVTGQARMQAYLGLPEAKEESPDESVKSNEGKSIIVAPAPPPPEQAAGLRRGAQLYAQLAASAYNQLGLLHARQSDFKKAADYFAGAAGWDPQVPDVYFNLGLAQFKAQNYAEAIAPLEKVRAQQPKRQDAQTLLGISYFFSGDYAHAKDQLDPLVQSGLDDPQAVYALGLSLAHSGAQPRGEGVLRGLVQRYPNVADAHLALGQALAMGGKYEPAAAEFARALEIDAAMPEAHYYLGLSLVHQGKFAEAAKEFQQELSRDPNDAKARYHLGLCLVSMNRMDEAVQSFNEALRLNPSYAEAYYELGKARLAQGQTEEAVSLLEKAAHLDGEKSYIQYQLSQAYLKAGKTDAAQTALARYRELKVREHNAPHGTTGMGDQNQ